MTKLRRLVLKNVALVDRSTKETGLNEVKWDELIAGRGSNDYNDINSQLYSYLISLCVQQGSGKLELVLVMQLDVEIKPGY